jgi:two-component system, chemotaxis family, response regulator Rcp1
MSELQILLIEDNPADIVLAREALAGYPTPVSLHVARDGEDALAMLSNREFHLDIIILDLNMPRVDGHTLLSQCRRRDVPIVIFSSTQNVTEVRRALALGAVEYVLKPIGFEAYADAVRGIVNRWSGHLVHA